MSTEGRLFFTVQDVERLRSNTRDSRFRPLWAEVLKNANKDPREDPDPGAKENRVLPWAQHLLYLVLAYLVERDDKYSQVGKELLLELTRSDTWMELFHKQQHPTMVSDLGTAGIVVNSVLAYEAFAQVLTTDERKQIEAGFLTKAIEPILSDTERGIWWTKAYNSNWCGVMYSALGLAALYLKSYEKGTEALKLATDKDKKVLDATGPQGEGVEGVSYWLYNFSNVALFAEALERSGQKDLKSHPFWQKALDFPLFFLMPDIKGWAPFSDTPYIGFGNEHFFYWLAGHLWDQGEEDRSQQAQWLGDAITEERQAKAGPMNLLWRRDEIEPHPPEERPAHKFFPLIHTAALRTGWDRKDSLFVFKGGSADSPHRHLDLASVSLAIGEDRLLADPGKGEYSFRYWTNITPSISTLWHNTLVVDGSNQQDPYTFFGDENRRQEVPSACRVEEFLQTDFAVLLSADATSAYSDQLRRFRRHVFWLCEKEASSPLLIVLMDDIKAKDMNIKRDFALHYHTPCDVEILDQRGTALIRGKETELQLQVLASSDCLLEVSEPTQIGGACLRRLTVHAYWILRHPDLEETSKVQFVTLLIPFVPGEDRANISTHKEPDLVAAQVKRRDKISTLLFPRLWTGRKFKAFGITTDAQACLVCQDRQGLKAFLLLKGREVVVDGKKVFSSRQQQNYCWVKKEGV